MIYTVDAIRTEVRIDGNYEYKYVDCYTKDMTQGWLEIMNNERYKILNFRKKAITFMSKRDNTDIFVLRNPKSQFRKAWLEGYYTVPEIPVIGYNATEENINEELD